MLGGMRLLAAHGLLWRHGFTVPMSGFAVRRVFDERCRRFSAGD